MLRGQRAAARQQYEEALVMCRATGNVLGEAQTCNSMAELLENDGSLEQALHYRERALIVYQPINEPDSLSITLSALCGVLTHLGDYQRAWQRGRAALELRQRHGLVNHFLYYRLALVAFHSGDEGQARQLVTAALAEACLLYTSRCV